LRFYARPRLPPRLRLACDLPGGSLGREAGLLSSLSSPVACSLRPDTCGVAVALWRDEEERRKGAVAVLMIVEEPREVGPTAEGAGWWKSARPKKRGPTPLCCPGYVCTVYIQMQKRNSGGLLYLPLKGSNYINPLCLGKK
jgi:hypothetical protein